MKIDNVEDIYELSPLQEGLLFHTLLTPGAGMYFEQVGFRLDGPLEVQEFERAWQTVLNRHTILRTSFRWQDLDKPLQVVHRSVRLPVEHIDWSDQPIATAERDLDAFLRADRARGFDLSEAPLLRLAVIALSDGTRYIVLSAHHLLLDGWSSDLVYNEAAELYAAGCRGERATFPESRPFGDYIAWLQQQDLSAAEPFWRQRLAGYAGEPPAGVEWLSVAESDCGEEQIQLSAAETLALQSVARRHRLTPNTIVQGAWALLLGAYTGVDDVVFGYTVSGRPGSLPGADSMVGLFINTLPLRVRLAPDDRLIPWLTRIQTAQLEASTYESTPLALIQQWSDTGGAPLFTTLVDYGNFPVSTGNRDRRAAMHGVRTYSRTNYRLNLLVWPGTELLLKILYNSSRHDADEVSGMLRCLRTLLGGIVADPERRLSELPLVTEAEERRLLLEWNQTATTYPRNDCIHRLFERRSLETPDTVAVLFGEERLTYAQLNRKANQLAHQLVRRGAKAGSIVAISVERSLEMVVGVLAILKAGAAYLPLDRAPLHARLLRMMQDSDVKILVQQGRRMKEDEAAGHGIQVCAL